MNADEKKGTVAVVLLHGIGEQRPMETLRSFVEGIFDKPPRSKPDRLSELFEVRRLNVKFDGRNLHCYELYWAHLIHGSEVKHIAEWFWRLIRKRNKKYRKIDDYLKTYKQIDDYLSAKEVDEYLKYKKIDEYLRKYQKVDEYAEEFKKIKECYEKNKKIDGELDDSSYVTTRWIVVGVLLLVAVLVSIAVFLLDMPKLVPGGLLFVLTVVTAFVVHKLVAYVGDAARYFDNAPPNVGARQDIRKQCVQFLEVLTESKNPSYSRIIVIGHSLGSVIAYDALKLLWAKSEKHVGITVSEENEKMKHYNEALLDWLHGECGRPKGETASSPQRALFEKLPKSEKHRWKISDLVTVGSPLTHALPLFTEAIEELKLLQAQRELPTCPPQPDQSDGGWCGWVVEGDRRFEFHHAALFSIVQWTNCYFPSDPIGGPLRPFFGHGIRDVLLPVRDFVLPIDILNSLIPRAFRKKLRWIDHTRYWSDGSQGGSATFREEIRRIIKQY